VAGFIVRPSRRRRQTRAPVLAIHLRALRMARPNIACDSIPCDLRSLTDQQHGGLAISSLIRDHRSSVIDCRK
jgi:hypothetical protein